MSGISIPIEVIASGAFLSEAHLRHLFGDAHAMEVLRPRRGLRGQFVYKEHIMALGEGHERVRLPICGPAWEVSRVELTPADAKTLGLQVPVQATHDLRFTGSCVLQGSAGVVEIKEGVVIPASSLYCSPDEARLLGVRQGEQARFCLSDRPRVMFNEVTVRVHPTYTLLLSISPSDPHVFDVSSGAIAQRVVS